jgi:dTDP-4-amino-4,6-dideoxygalactose transaminase
MTTALRSSPRQKPAFDEPLLVGRPNLGDAADLQRRVQQIIDRRWLSNDGVMVQEFERRVANIAGVKHCLTVCNATVGLEVAVRAAGLTGEVIVPANTFVATAHALEWQRIRPVFCDIDPETHNLDPAAVEQCITPRTSGIIGVHLWGRPCATAELEKIAARHGLKLLFDAAHAFGCSSGGRPIGGFALAEIFSFHATKFVNCGEGGAIVTNDDDFAERVRRMRNFGIAGCDYVVSEGTNGKMSEFAAAVGLTSLDSMDDFLAVNDQNQALYRRALAGVPGIELINYEETEHNNLQYVVAEVDENRSPLTRDQWLQVLHAENVLARRYFYPGVHRMEPYCRREPDAARRLPMTEAVLRRVLVLPGGAAVGEQEIEIIGNIFHDAAVQANDLSSQLPRVLPLPTAPLAAYQEDV